MGEEQKASRSFSELKIKHLSPEFSGRLSDIDQDCNVPPWTPALFKREIKAEHSVGFGAHILDKLVGFILFHKLYESAHIVTLGIDPEFRELGIASALLDTAIRKMHEVGIFWVTLEVRQSNLAAQALYQKAGFYEAGIRENYYSSNKEDALILKASIVDYVHSRRKDDVAV